MWFGLSIVAMLSYGVLDFLFKVARERKLDFSSLLMYYYWTAAISAFSLFALSPEPIGNFPFLAFFALVQVSFYLVSNVLKLESLKHIKSVLAYPIFSLHGVATAVLAFVFLGESLSPIQYAGIAISVAAILLLLEKRHHISLNKGVLLAFAAMLALSCSEVVVAAVIDNLVVLPFIALSYLFAIGPSVVIEKNIHKRGGSRNGAAKIGAAMGLANVLAFYSLLTALKTGMAAIVFPIISLSLLVSLILSMAVYGEKLNRLKMVAVALALLAIILMRL